MKMRNLLTAMTLALGVAGASVVQAASPSIGVVNYMQVFQQVPQGSATLEKMKADLKPQVDQLKSEQAALQQQIQDLNRNAPTLSKDALAAQQQQLSQKESDFQKKVASLEKTESQKEQAAATLFNDDLNAAISQVATKNNLNLVLNSQAVPYVASGYDITDQVVTVMKAE